MCILFIVTPIRRRHEFYKKEDREKSILFSMVKVIGPVLGHFFLLVLFPKLCVIQHNDTPHKCNQP